jgi:hypothetical protein
MTVSRALMKVLAVLVTLLLSQSLPAATPPADPFRVTGIITIDNRNIALIELADGTQQQLRAGDTFAGGKVLDITPNAVRLGFNETERIISLQGADIRSVPPLINTPVYVHSPQSPLAGTSEQVLQREVIGGGLEDELGRISADLDRKAAPPADLPVPSPEKSAEPSPEPSPEPSQGHQTPATTTELTRLLDPLVNLPPGARVVGIDHAPAASAREGIEQIRQALAAGNVVRLNLKGKGGGDERIYLMPDRSGE